MARVRFTAAALVALLAFVVLAAPVQGRLLRQFSVVTPTLNPFTGPRVTTVGPFGGVSSTTVRATPFNPFVGPVVTTTNVRPTPLNPFVGPVVTRNSVAIGR